MIQPTVSILVVDDEPNNLEVIKILLHKDAYELIYASNGFEALAKLEVHQPDLILLDVMMPDLSGLEVCRRIKSQPALKHIPIIMVTALGSKENLSQCLELGADDFVAKPINGLELRARLKSMLRLKQQYDALQDMLKLREDMSNMIVHDLRNPITNIFLACRIMKLHGLTERQQQKLKQIEYSGRRLEEMVDSLLIMAKMDASVLSLKLDEIDICELAQNAIADFQEIAEQQNINIVWDFSETTGKLLTDATLMRRVLDNLMSNALKFSLPNTQVVLKIDSPVGCRVRIQIQDQGRGVSEEVQQRLFEKFEIGEVLNSVSQTGLGLAFCKLVVEAHHGQISVEPNQPRGSIFTIEL